MAWEAPTDCNAHALSLGLVPTSKENTGLFGLMSAFPATICLEAYLKKAKQQVRGHCNEKMII